MTILLLILALSVPLSAQAQSDLSWCPPALAGCLEEIGQQAVGAGPPLPGWPQESEHEDAAADSANQKASNAAARAAIRVLKDCGGEPCGFVWDDDPGNALLRLCSPRRMYLGRELWSLLRSLDGTYDASALVDAAVSQCVRYLVAQASTCTVRRHSSSGGNSYSLAGSQNGPASYICEQSKAHWPPEQTLKALWEERRRGSSIESLAPRSDRNEEALRKLIKKLKQHGISDEAILFWVEDEIKTLTKSNFNDVE